MPRALPAVALDGVSRRYGVIPALGGVDLLVRSGSVVALLGPNGAGKTTLLRVLATLARPHAGVARVDGFDVVRQADEVRRRVGYVGHAPPLPPHLTVTESLRYAARLHGVRLGDEALHALLEEAGLSRRRHAEVRTLSRGLAQRLALQGARLHAPSVLLLDEPHTGLDPRAADDLDRQVRAMASAGQTVLLASHDLARARAVADRVVVLRRGRVAWDVPTADVSLDALAERYAVAVTGPPGGMPEAPRPATASPPEPVDAPARPAPSFAGVVAAVLWKDVVVELRAREVVPPVLVFALLMVVIFQFAMPASNVARESLAAGALWVALLFGSTLGLSRLMAGEADSGGLEALLASPLDRGALFAGKWLAGYAFSLLVAAALLPAFVALLSLRVSVAQLAGVAGIIALGLVGWVASGVLLAAMAVATRAREVLLPVLLYPLVLPLVVPAVQGTGRVLEGTSEGLAEAIALVVAYDVVFWVLGFLLFGRALEDA